MFVERDRNVGGREMFHVKHYFYLYIVINTTISTNARVVGVRSQQAGGAAVRETVHLLGDTSTVAPPGVVIH